MTTKEKKERASARAWLREEGLLPPKKKPINKKKVIAEAKEASGRFNSFIDWRYIEWGIVEMLEHHDYSGGKGIVSDQAVGVAKVILLAVRRKDLDEQRKASGENKPLTVDEVYEAVKDIYDL